MEKGDLKRRYLEGLNSVENVTVLELGPRGVIPSVVLHLTVAAVISTLEVIRKETRPELTSVRFRVR